MSDDPKVELTEVVRSRRFKLGHLLVILTVHADLDGGVQFDIEGYTVEALKAAEVSKNPNERPQPFLYLMNASRTDLQFIQTLIGNVNRQATQEESSVDIIEVRDLIKVLEAKEKAAAAEAAKTAALPAPTTPPPAVPATNGAGASGGAGGGVNSGPTNVVKDKDGYNQPVGAGK